MNKKTILIHIGCALTIGLILFLIWQLILRPTQVALLNFQPFQVAKIVKSNTNQHMKYSALSVSELENVKNYDAVLVFGMGIRLNDIQRGVLNDYMENGGKLITVSATDPENALCNLDSLQKATLSSYLNNGGKENYMNMSNYIRGTILGKSFWVDSVSAPIVAESMPFFHLDGEPMFKTLQEYENWYGKEYGHLSNGAKVAIIPGMMSPTNSSQEHIDSIVVRLEKKGLRVYPFSSVMERKKILEEINPDAIIYMPHGRLMMGQADFTVALLNKLNAPLFCPLLLNQTYENWMNDPMGMSGGFMSQSIIMPEIDGGINPMSLVAQYKDNEDNYTFATIPEKLEQFVDCVDNYLSLKKKANRDKKVAIYYYKGAGSGAMAAAGLETAPSLFNLLTSLKKEGYNVDGLPTTAKEFEQMIQERGPVFNSYAEGNSARFEQKGYQAVIEKSEFDSWLNNALCRNKGMIETLSEAYGEADDQRVTRIELGNVVILPQPVQGMGENDFAAVHGSNAIPPYHYIASYLWTRYGFGADAMIHFGTHGSLEFVPGKQVALSHEDWTDRLVGSIPHFYIYTIADVGEGVIAKRRSYATLLTHLTPAFRESGMNNKVEKLKAEIKKGNEKEVRRIVKEMGLSKDLKLNLEDDNALSESEMEEIGNYAEELVQEKITSGLYTLGEQYETDRIVSSVKLMSIDPIAYSLAAFDKLKGKITQKEIDNQTFFTKNYRQRAVKVVTQQLSNPAIDVNKVMLSLGISQNDIERADSLQIELMPKREKMMKMMMAMSENNNSKGKPKGHPAGMPKGGEMHDFVKKMIAERKEAEAKADAKERQKLEAMNKSKVSKEDREFAQSIANIRRTIENIGNYRKALEESPKKELEAVAKALNGDYIEATSGGDFISNAQSLPTGRNLFAVNTEATPSVDAWEKGVKMGEEMLNRYRAAHNDSLPRKVSFTLWSGAFIESEGATLAEILYLLGVEPVRDQFDRVIDVKLIEGMTRPRIDVVVQTSGQFRDVAASRLFLLNKAVEMAATADDSLPNFVALGKKESERHLLDKGFTPQEANELSTARIFGGLNGMSGTGIQGMVMASDRWENDSEIAERYIHNMSAMYGSEKSWGKEMGAEVFKAALLSTDAIVQPRQSNTWGAISLDHVYEFMGGLNVAVRNTTGKNAENYFNDLRNRNNARTQTLDAAIGVESRTTIFNEVYIKDRMKGGSSSAAGIAEVVENIFGWNVMKPDAIDNEMWNELHRIYVKDSMNLGVKNFFETTSPAALQEMTAVMMESARKGYWKASEEQLKELSALHTELVEKYDACCNQFTCNNTKLREFVSQHSAKSDNYLSKIDKAINRENISSEKNIVMEKQKINDTQISDDKNKNGLMHIAIIITIIVIALLFIRKKKQK